MQNPQNEKYNSGHQMRVVINLDFTAELSVQADGYIYA